VEKRKFTKNYTVMESTRKEAGEREECGCWNKDSCKNER
jgi:hypothetical protein